MTDDELEALAEELERALMADVRAVLDEVASEFASGVDDATELVAARFSVSRIADMWRSRVPRVLDGIRSIYRRSAEAVANDIGESLSDGPGYGLESYVTDVRPLVEAVGDHLAQRAVDALSEGLNDGDDIDQLKARLLELFSADGTHLGAAHAEVIAQTEATRAFNAGALAAAGRITGPDRPLVKQWITRMDTRVRDAHREVNGQIQLLDEPFDVGGEPMRYPGDPAAPASLTVGCRCVMRVSAAERNPGMEETTADAGGGELPSELQSRMPEQLKDYWLSGPGAARIGWGTPGSFDRCVSALRDDFPQDPEGLCANLYHEATGRWPGQRNSAETADMEEGWSEETDGIISWSTPGEAALAFENEQTGDGRVFSPGALYWGEGPWPLQYAEEMNGGHDGARLAGAIESMTRVDHRILGSGVLYLTQDAGLEAAMLLSQGAPLGVSVDLDDVSMELVSTEAESDEPFVARFTTASVLPLPDGGYVLTGETEASWAASGASMVGESSRMSFHVTRDGRVPASAFTITSAAGDPDYAGTVMERRESGEYLTRITRGRVRGATLVSIPAFADARIVLDDMSRFASVEVTAAATDADYHRVVRFVMKSRTPSSVAATAHTLNMPVVTVGRHLAEASRRGQLVKIARGTYVRNGNWTPGTAVSRPSFILASVDGDEITASATGMTTGPVAPRDHPWDGPAAEARVFEWADGDCSRLDRAFAYRDDSVDDCTQHNSRKLGYADIIDGTLTIVPRGVFAAQAALDGARGGVDIPSDQVSAVRDRLATVRGHVDEVTGGDGQRQMEASAWAAMSDLPPMPAEWFREPTADELPPGGAGVNYSNGRIFGWVAQAGEPHAGHAKKITIEGLGHIDTSHFLRQKFTLDDGTVVKAGAFTMNVGHHRDGAECETSSCQFDDTRTVAGIVTVGMNERGMWFSGAAAPWLSTWDRSVFMATQPSYHMKRGPGGNWQLRAVLAVPVPGHSSPLLASAVVERAQLALTAAAAMAEVESAVEEGERILEDATAPVVANDPRSLEEMVAAAVNAALDAREARKAAELEEARRLMDELRALTDEQNEGN